MISENRQTESNRLEPSRAYGIPGGVKKLNLDFQMHQRTSENSDHSMFPDFW